jgi:hypothetical protein
MSTTTSSSSPVVSTSSSSKFGSLKSWSSSALDKTDTVLSKWLKGFSNQYLFNIILIVLILYAPIAAPKLDKSIAGVLNNYIVKIVYVFFLAYLLSNRNIKVAVVTSLIIVVGMFLLKRFDTNENFADVQTEQVKEQEKPVERRVKFADQEQDISQVSGIQMDLGNIPAEATHDDALKPLKTNTENIKVAQGPMEEVIDVCGSRLSKDGYSGYAETDVSLGDFESSQH